MIYSADTLTEEALGKFSVLPSRGAMFKLCMDKISPEGHLMEFGVYVGHSVNYLADLVKPRMIHGFDSFEGLPEAWEMNASGLGHHKKGHFALKALPEVRDNVRLYKGWFSDSLPVWLGKNTGNMSFVHIDSDLYSSAIYVLKTLNHLLLPGTVILFDELSDWAPVPSGGVPKYSNWRDHEWKALNEWMRDCKREISLIARTTTYQAAIKIEK